ncbi:MAG: pilus assembly protein TadE [Actinomycetales bacterium]|nr:pilus assembly protein TadE [Actinomycetales bacterium]
MPERPRHGQRGTVSAEFALALPAVVLVLLFCLAVLVGGMTQLRAGDAARAGARAAALGAEPGEVRAIVLQLAGPEAAVAVSTGTLVHVRVSVPVPLLREWGAARVHADAVAVPEP